MHPGRDDEGSDGQTPSVALARLALVQPSGRRSPRRDTPVPASGARGKPTLCAASSRAGPSNTGSISRSGPHRRGRIRSSIALIAEQVVGSAMRRAGCLFWILHRSNIAQTRRPASGPKGARGDRRCPREIRVRRQQSFACGNSRPEQDRGSRTGAPDPKATATRTNGQPESYRSRRAVNSHKVRQLLPTVACNCCLSFKAAA
jgi:hypothetical protein